MTPSSVDGELVLISEQADNGIGALICLMANHVDDLKLTGKRKVIERVLQQIQEVFGELKSEWYTFTNCGLRHLQGPNLFDHPRPRGIHQECEANYPSGYKRPLIRYRMHSCNHSTVHGSVRFVAFALMTRIDVAVLVCAMQGVIRKPKIIHARRLNAVLRWMQANPKRLTFRPATGPSHLRCVGDAACKKEGEAGHSLRGALFLRSFSDTNHCVSNPNC